MTLEDAKSFGELAAFIVLGGYTAWKSRKAAKQTVATGNGFAKSVEDALDRLMKGQIRNDKANARIERKIDDHIAAHANAEVASHPRLRRVLPDVNEL